jgi:3-phosphoshikimate 1-carboxyvinyltransferase
MSKHLDARVLPVKSINGMLRLPGDKSISHRYAMLAAIATGRTRIENFSTGADCASTLACVRALGASVRQTGSTVDIQGCGRKLKAPAHQLDCGNSGSTMRMLAGILAGQDFQCELVGDESLSRRPMTRVIEPLQMMGAEFESQQGKPPLKIKGGTLRAVRYKLPVASAQVKSAVLFAGLFAKGETAVEEPVRTRDHSEHALQAFGVPISRDGNSVSVQGGHALSAIEATIPGDISTAAFFLCAAALLPGSDLTLDGLSLNPTRAALLDVLVALGLKLSIMQVKEHHGELTGVVHAQHGALKGLEISGATSAALIDELPVLAAVAPFTEKGVEIHDARELRVKESDRIAAVAANLRAMGASVEEFEDGLRVPGGQRLRGARVSSFGDHRIAMAFAIAALRADGETIIEGADSARISFPEFFETLEGVARR